MKLLRTLMLSFVLLLVSSVGVFAQTATPPTYYIKADGSASTIPTGMKQIASSPAEGTNPAQTSTLEFGNTTNSDGSVGPFYWAGDSLTETEDVTNITLGSGQGTLNIVIGPNTNTGVAMIMSSTSWQIKQNQTINIFQASSSATAASNEYSQGECFATIQASSETTSAITVNGGNLNVNSGVLDPTGNGAPGLLLESGNVTISSHGQLQPTFNNDTYTTEITGLNITGGTLTNQGYLRVNQNNGTTWHYASITDNPTGSGQGLVMQGGTVQALNAYSENPDYQYGVWIQQMPTGTDGTTYPKVNAFSINPTSFEFNTGQFISFPFKANTSLTIEENASVTIPNGVTFTFAPTDDTTINATNGPKLTVNGQLIIAPNATVNMNANSQLENNGTITVESSTPETKS